MAIIQCDSLLIVTLENWLDSHSIITKFLLATLLVKQIWTTTNDHWKSAIIRVMRNTTFICARHLLQKDKFYLFLFSKFFQNESLGCLRIRWLILMLALYTTACVSELSPHFSVYLSLSSSLQPATLCVPEELCIASL